MREMSWTTSRWTSEEREFIKSKLTLTCESSWNHLLMTCAFTMYRLEQVSRAFLQKYSMKLLEALSQFKTQVFFSDTFRGSKGTLGVTGFI